MQVYCNDLYDLNETNTTLYDEHAIWYIDFKAASVGDLLDRQQDMITSYKKAIDNSTEELESLKCELANLKNELEVVSKELEDSLTPNRIGQL